MTATLRLWLEPGESLDDPLAAAIFNDLNRGQPRGLPFPILQADPKGSTAEKSRRDSLIEIGYARALYRLGDHEGLGRKSSKTTPPTSADTSADMPTKCYKKSTKTAVKF
jgi:hypothetical protein